MASRRQEEEQRLRLSEQTKLERLKTNVAHWEEAQRIRAYLAAVRQHAEARAGGLAESGSGASRCTLLAGNMRAKTLQMF